MFPSRPGQHNQATFEGVTMLTNMLAGAGGYKQITNCFLLAAPKVPPGDKATIEWNWDYLQEYLADNALFASVGSSDPSQFGAMTVAAMGIASEGAARLVSTVYFPANSRPSIAAASIDYLVLVAGGNIRPNTGDGYRPSGGEAVMAVVDMSATPLLFEGTVDNNFTWTIFFTPIAD